MHYSSIRSHLKPYVIVTRRKTTINHAFAAAIAPSDFYEDAHVREAILCLGQDPDKDLACVYCGDAAQTWDHVFATVKASQFSGYGHRVGNLLPCCKSCNSSKGNKDWYRYLTDLDLPNQFAQGEKIKAYLARYSSPDSIPNDSFEYRRLQGIRQQVMALLVEADQLAKIIRETAI
jgi:hypothetical protein